MKKIIEPNPGYAGKKLEVPKEIEKAFDKAMFEQREALEIIEGLKNERQMLQLVASGDLDGLLLFSKEKRPPMQVGFLLEDALRQSRYMLVSGITLLTRAAIVGGLAEMTAFNLSDVYIQKCTSLTKASDVFLLLSIAARDFTQRVAEIKRKPHYSHPVAMGCEYISAHLHYHIYLNEIAENCGFSPSYYSKLFKCETGQSVTEYILLKRLECAKHMLLVSSEPIQSISDYLAFSSHSQFTASFKKEYNISPSKFRANAEK
ncbi:MAG: AraC family transcriptional regulator [Oscillospiraceae bacterium]